VKRARRDRRAEGPAGSRPGAGRRAATVAPWLAAAVAVVLALPDFGFAWLWDDFDFLSRSQIFRPSFLLPDPGSMFYRPLSRDLYFWLVWRLGGGQPFLGHLFNAAVLACSTLLLVEVAARLCGRRAGVLAGLSFAALGAAPLLVAWVSGVQDLLAILFTLIALRLALDDRPALSALAAAAALLSKETAIAAVPAVAALPWILGWRARPSRQILPFAALLAAWIAVHPGLRLVLHRTAAGEAASYIGLGPSGRVPFLLSTLATMGNLPAPGAVPGDPARHVFPLALAGLLMLAALWVTRWRAGTSRERPGSPAGAPAGISDPPGTAPLAGRVVILAGLLALLPALLPALLVRQWAPYYAVVPAVGSSLVIGLILSRLPGGAAGAALIGFLVLGAAERGMGIDAKVTCERNLEVVSRALAQVQAGFKRLHPAIPAGAQALVSVAGTGAQSVPHHIHRLQALRVWYGQPTLVTRQPERRRAGSAADFLFRITPLLDVIELNPDSTLFRSSGGQPRVEDVDRPTRSYARGVAASGDPERAARILLRLSQLDAGQDRDYDLRLAAMAWYAAGRNGPADSIVRATPYPRREALRAIGKVYAEPTASAALDALSFRAFGVAPTDTAAARFLMHALRDAGYWDAALDFARRLERLVPGDPESGALLRGGRPPADRITSPVEPDSL
jgi:hypothetical protein